MKWWKCELIEVSSNKLLAKKYVRAEEPRAAIASLGWFNLDLPERPTANEVDPSEVPAVQRGLTEASLEELFAEVNKRGFKVVQK